VARKDQQETKASLSGSDPGSDETALAPSGQSTPGSVGVESLPNVGDEAYARRGEIARGGLGRIVEATDKRLKRVVALKELRRHTPEAAARFVREALVTARLQHPGIVPIYEAGRWPDGEPFYAMKLVSGTSLADAITAGANLDERLALLPRVTAVADTIAYAHVQRVIHRDLKPHNVMCGDFGETVVIDWGLAKDLAAPEEPEAKAPSGQESGSDQTVEGTVMGTPAYMPPEQARGEAVDERADVYAIGALLYHVLAGVAPYRASAEQGVLAGPPPALETVVVGVPRDLVAIVTKAMAREPSARYPSAREMAEDLRRFQMGNLVSVREYTAAERLARWLKRYRATVAVAAIAVVVLVVVGAFSFVRVMHERDRASHEMTVARDARVQAEVRENDLKLLQARGQLDRDPTQPLAWLTQLADVRLDATTASVAADAVSRGVSAHVIRLDAGRLYGLGLGANGRGWALAQDSRLFALDTNTGKFELAWKSGDPAVAFASTPDGTAAAVGTANVLAVVSHGTRDVTAVDGPVISLGLDATGGMVVLGMLDGRVLVRPRSGAETITLDRFGAGAEVRVVAFSPDGTHVAAAAWDGTVAAYRLADRKRVLRGNHGSQIWSLDWAPDGSAIVSGGQDGTARVWPIDGRPPVVLTGHSGAVIHVAFDASSQRIATASRDHTVKLWSRDGHLAATLAHEDEVFTVMPLRDGGWASAGSDHTIRRWDAEGAAVAVLRGHTDFLTQLALSPDGELLASGGQDGSVRVWKTALDRDVVVAHATALSIGRETPTVVTVHDGHVLVREADGKTVDRGPGEGIERLYPVDDKIVLGLGPRGKVTRHTDDGARTLIAPPTELGGVTEQAGVVFGAGYDGKLWRWTDLAAAPTGLPADATYVLTIVRVPGGELVATGGADGTLRLWHPDGRVERVLTTGGGPVHHIAASPDGKLVAAGGLSGDVIVWNVGDGRELVRYRHSGQVQSLAFSPGSDRVISAGDDRNIQVYALDGTHVTLTGHLKVASSIAATHDGKVIAAGATDGSVLVWDVATRAGRMLRGHRNRVTSLAFEPTGALLTGGDDGRVLRWSAGAMTPPPATPGPLRAWIAARTDATVPP
jgi:WD40 repeat protein